MSALERGWQFHYVAEVFFEYRRAEQSMLTRAIPLYDQVVEFVARKHGLLYRRAWLSTVNDRKSVKWTLNNLRKLLRCRVKARFNKHAGASVDLVQTRAPKSL